MLIKIKDLESQRQVSPSLISKIMLLKLGSKALTESVSLPRSRVHILRNERYQVSLAFLETRVWNQIYTSARIGNEYFIYKGFIIRFLWPNVPEHVLKWFDLFLVFSPQETCHPPCSAKIWLVAISHSSLYKEKNYQLCPKTGGSEPASTRVINVNKC